MNNLVKWAAVQVPRGSGVLKILAETDRRGGREGRGKAPAVYHGGRYYQREDLELRGLENSMVGHAKSAKELKVSAH